jgi:hypothetical protein
MTSFLRNNSDIEISLFSKVKKNNSFMVFYFLMIEKIYCDWIYSPVKDIFIKCWCK